MSIAFLVLADRAELPLLVLPPRLLLILLILLPLRLPLVVLLVVRLRMVRFRVLFVLLRLIEEEEEDFLGMTGLAQHNI